MKVILRKDQEKLGAVGALTVEVPAGGSQTDRSRGVAAHRFGNDIGRRRPAGCSPRR